MNIPTSFGLSVSGIYCITNNVTHKVYIGSSKNIYHRLKRHYSELCRNVHANPILQNSFNKHGKQSFNVSILEEVDFVNLAVREQFYIDTCKPAYNITYEVVRNTPSTESRLKTSNTLKKQKELGLLKYPTHDDKKKPVAIYDMFCKCVGVFESESSAAKHLTVLYPGLKHSQAIVNNRVNNRRHKSPNKKYKFHYLLRPDETCYTDIRHRSDSVPVILIDTVTNEHLEFPKVKSVAEYLSCSESAIRRALKNNNITNLKYKVMKK